MENIRIFALCLAIFMVLPMMFSCGSAKKGEPNTFTNVTVTSYYDPEATTTNAASDFEDELFSGEVIVYAEAGTSIKLKDVIIAYCEDKNVDYYFDSAKNMFTKINGISKNDNYFWNYAVNGKDAGLADIVTPEDSIEISFTK